MKRIICLLMITAVIFTLAACSGSESKIDTTDVVSSKSESADSVIDSALEQAQAPSPTAGAKDTAAESADGVDVDLTAMSSTMVYSEVLNMQKTPEKYLGKVVKMKGPFSATEIDGNRYFACIIKDATACCSSGIEFEWAGDHSYPEDYPKENQEITVIGTFTTYMEGKNKYLQLKDADVQF